jgi:hypothetical protein
MGCWLCHTGAYLIIKLQDFASLETTHTGVRFTLAGCLDERGRRDGRRQLAYSSGISVSPRSWAVESCTGWWVTVAGIPGIVGSAPTVSAMGFHQLLSLLSVGNIGDLGSL